MKNPKNTRRVAGVSLAAAVAGAFALTPVEAQEINPLDIARTINGANSVINNNLDRVAGSVVKTVKPGSGSADARYSSGGWTYTAVAYYPGADRIYAISTGEGGKPAGHLLRIKPDMDQLADLGALDLRGINTKDVASAAITPSGVLVLFSGSEFRTLSLAKDDLTNPLFADKIKDASSLAVKSQKLTLPAGTGEIGFPSAWASSTDPEKQHELYAISRDKRGGVHKWTLDTTNGRVAIDQVAVRQGLLVDAPSNLNYAYTKPNDTFVFADDQARTIELKGTEVVATGTNEVVDNFRELAYLPLGAGYKPVTQFNKPAPLPGEHAVPAASSRPDAAEIARDLARVGDAANDVARAVGDVSVPTVVAERGEPTPSPAAAAPAAPAEEVRSEATVFSAEARRVPITVADDKGRAVKGAAVNIADLGVSTDTDRNGQVVVDVPAGTGAVDVLVEGETHELAPTDKRMYVTLLADGGDGDTGADANAGGTAGTGDGKKPETRKLEVTVKDDAGRVEPNVKLKVVSDDYTGRTSTTNRFGDATLDVPVTEGKFYVEIEGNRGGTWEIGADQESLDITIDSAPASGNEKPKYADATIGITVKTDGGDPVQYAQVYSVHGLDVEVRGETDENGLVYVFIPGNVGNGKEVTLGVRTAPNGYRTAQKSISRESDGAEIVLPKASTSTTSTKSTPQQILDVIEEVQPLVAALAGPAALGAGMAKGGTKTTSTTTTETTGARATTLNGKVSTGRTTSVAGSGGSRTTVTNAKGSTVVRSTSNSSSDDRDDDLADTGTPMQTVISLGILALIIGGAYVAMGRRREA
ncbi:hypothetical protein V6D40_09105 [Corynebacterium sp. Q4381]|uniref:hypothetical protein n=1 Tax=Corynebacterium sp. Marseille-Q4381 TaxID=3121597 RepID=UPI002FE52415